MKILVPMAAPSSFFPKEDYPFPKPLIEISGQTMAQRLIDNLKHSFDDPEFVFIISNEDARQFSLSNTLRFLTDGRCEVVTLREATQGALCSCLMAIDHIDPEEELIICNGDQAIEDDLSAAIDDFRRKGAAAGVVTFNSVHPRWSYAKLAAGNSVVQAEEKMVISKNAIAGFYYFSRGADFLETAMRTIKTDRTVNRQFYIAPALNELILQSKPVCAYPIASDRYYSFYSPAKIAEYEERHSHMASRDTLDTPEISSLNVVIPAAGEGSRFKSAGYDLPKPFIDVEGKQMLQQVIDNISLPKANHHLLLRADHVSEQKEVVRNYTEQGHSIQTVAELTEGTACTLLLARPVLDNEAPLLVANSDQLVELDYQAFVEDCFDRDLDGSILVFQDRERNPKWSFAKVDDDDCVTRVAEKDPISDLATVGVYLFRRGSDFVAAAIDMIARNERVNGEFYTCPVYNHMINAGLKIGVYRVDAGKMHGLGTPDDLEQFLASRKGAA